MERTADDDSWDASLPPEIRERIRQGKMAMDDVPEEYRDMVEDYFKGLAEGQEEERE